MDPVQSAQDMRKNRLANIRASLQENPLLKKNKISLENKLQKMSQQREEIKN